MVTVTYVQSDGRRVEVRAQPGDTVMTAATDNDVPGIIGDCGGGMSCATCHVLVAAPWSRAAGPRAVGEEATLDETAVPATAESRLGCQIILDDALDGLVVHVPERQE